MRLTIREEVKKPKRVFGDLRCGELFYAHNTKQVWIKTRDIGPQGRVYNCVSLLDGEHGCLISDSPVDAIHATATVTLEPTA